MSKTILLIVILGSALLTIGIGVSSLVNSPGLSVLSCTPVHIVAIGGCDSDGLCGIVAISQDKQVVKGKASYPVAGLVDCRESISE
jgi:hypothetical protein